MTHTTMNHPKMHIPPRRAVAGLSALLLALLLTACGGAGNDGEAPPITDAERFGFPPPPVQFARQIDRNGRPAVATALVSPLADPGPRGVDRDAYNSAAQSNWTRFKDNIRGSLAIYDSLDGQCGNQVLAAAGSNAPTRYETLARALTDDRLYVNAASGACSQYLAVELNATGVAANNDCGGRTPREDVIDVTYTALSNNLAVAVGDGVDSDNVAQSDTVFPFLGDPTPPPAVPTLLARQIDRNGRPAVATALIAPLADPGPRGVLRDQYNAAAPAGWNAFRDEIRSNLAVYDGLDTMCGNQVLATAGGTTPERYNTLAGALADDRLYVNAASGTCVQYLGVELNATGVVANGDCGGRTPLEDVIDVTYTAITNNLSIPVGDAVNSDNVVHSNTEFPFLAAETPPPM